MIVFRTLRDSKDRMIKDGVSPNEVSFSTVIHGRAKRGQTKWAEEWLLKMLALGVEPSITSYLHLLTFF